jgi:hypothetical protein
MCIYIYIYIYLERESERAHDCISEVCQGITGRQERRREE